MADLFEPLDPHYNIPDIDKLYSVSGNLTLLSSVTSIVSNYLDNKNIDDHMNDTVFASLNKVQVALGSA